MMFSYAGQGTVMSSDISCYQTHGSWEYGDHDDHILLEVTTLSPKVWSERHCDCEYRTPG